MLASLAKRSVQGGERLPLRLPPRAARAAGGYRTTRLSLPSLHPTRPPPFSTGGKALCRQRAAALSLKPTVAARSADHDPSLFRCGGHSFHHAPTHATLTHRVEPRAPRFPPCTPSAPERTFEPLASSRAPCNPCVAPHLRPTCEPHKGARPLLRSLSSSLLGARSAPFARWLSPHCSDVHSWPPFALTLGLGGDSGCGGGGDWSG